jgi:cell division protein DivIC
MAASKDVSAEEVFKPLLNKIPTFFFNKYYLILSLFLLWLAFFDRNNLWSQYRIQQTYKKLEKDKVFFQNKLEELKVEKIDMANDKEKFAREEYFMKAADEDVFVIEKE